MKRQEVNNTITIHPEGMCIFEESGKVNILNMLVVLEEKSVEFTLWRP